MQILTKFTLLTRYAFFSLSQWFFFLIVGRHRRHWKLNSAIRADRMCVAYISLLNYRIISSTPLSHTDLTYTPLYIQIHTHENLFFFFSSLHDDPTKSGKLRGVFPFNVFTHQFVHCHDSCSISLSLRRQSLLKQCVSRFEPAHTRIRMRTCVGVRKTGNNSPIRWFWRFRFHWK